MAFGEIEAGSVWILWIDRGLKKPMNKYEILFKEILDGTRDGKLKWKQLNKRANSEVIFNPNLVFRQFSSQLTRGDSEFTVILVEKKYEDPAFDFYYEKYYVELLILEKSELVISITDSVIEKNDMNKLVDMVESKSDKAKNLFRQSRASELLEKLPR